MNFMNDQTKYKSDSYENRNTYHLTWKETESTDASILLFIRTLHTQFSNELT